MKYLILTLLLSFSFSECDELTEMQCASNADCEWIENIETEWCSSNNQSECLEQDVCYWYPGGFYLGAFCSGGSYEVDNSYCQENPNPPTCSEMSQIQCNSNSECEWIENTYTGNCSNLNGFTACEAAGCDWECGFSHGSCYWCCWYECGGGSYEIDNSYCQENSNPPACSEMSQTQCNNNSDCQWTEDTAIGDCDDINNGSDCYAIDECTWYSSGNYGYGFDGCYGGSYEIDSSYCEEYDYIQGDLNGDLTINILDVLLIIDIILNQESSDLADINGDGIVNILDVIELVDIIINR